MRKVFCEAPLLASLGQSVLSQVVVVPPGREAGQELLQVLECRHSRQGCGGQGRTAALKPRPTHRWPVRARDVHDVIQRTSGEGKLVVLGVVTMLHIKSPLWLWQQF